MSEPINLTIPEAAQTLKISERQVQNLIYNSAKNGFPSYCIGRSRRIPKDQLLKWVELQTQTKK